MLKRYQPLLGITLCSVLWLSESALSTTFTPVDKAPNQDVGRYTQFVLTSLLKQMDLEFDDAKKGLNKGGKNNKTSPETSTKDDDFFNDEDDFFNDGDDSSGVNFDEFAARFEQEFEDTTKAWDKQFEETVARWNKEYEDTVARWNKAREAFSEQQEQYAQATYDMGVFGSGALTEQPQPISQKFDLDALKAGEFHVIPNALETAVRDQVKRGTCAAFAGIRAVETVLNQHDSIKKMSIDLSEQHFFWMSRDDCFEEPCTLEKSNDGSSFDKGFAHAGTSRPEFHLRQESTCPYVPYPNKDNLSYTPLANCHQYKGQFQVGKTYPMLKFSQIIDELIANRPIAAGFRLPKSFYSTRGLIRLHDQNTDKQGLDGHAAGHAVLLVGFIKLPESMHVQEGNYCALMANSWGIGYGVGGHACLTEKWIEKFAFRDQRNPEHGWFTSVQEVRLIN